MERARVYPVVLFGSDTLKKPSLGQVQARWLTANFPQRVACRRHRSRPETDFQSDRRFCGADADDPATRISRPGLRGPRLFLKPVVFTFARLCATL
jgi:hypothetical protein